MKTKEELNALKNEVETLNKKLAELTEEELTQVSGGLVPPSHPVIFARVYPASEPPAFEPPSPTDLLKVSE